MPAPPRADRAHRAAVVARRPRLSPSRAHAARRACLPPPPHSTSRSSGTRARSRIWGCARTPDARASPTPRMPAPPRADRAHRADVVARRPRLSPSRAYAARRPCFTRPTRCRTAARRSQTEEPNCKSGSSEQIPASYTDTVTVSATLPPLRLGHCVRGGVDLGRPRAVRCTAYLSICGSASYIRVVSTAACTASAATTVVLLSYCDLHIPTALRLEY